MSRNAQDWCEVASLDRLFYLGPLTAMLQGWFDRWGSPFYAYGVFDGIALALLYHVAKEAVV